MIFPFPSSPHWAPTTTNTGMMTPLPTPQSALLYPDLLHRQHIRELPDLRHQLVGHGAVDAYDRHGHTALLLASELHARDIDPILAHQHPDAADDAGLVVVHEHEHIPVGYGLHGKIVHLDDAGLLFAVQRACNRQVP